MAGIGYSHFEAICDRGHPRDHPLLIASLCTSRFFEEFDF